nr:hypothetical protein [Clostridia bacterium]
MKKRTLISLSLLVVVILSLLLTTSCTPYGDRFSPSINNANALEDRYVIKELEYDIATYGGGPIKKPMVSQFNNISRQKTLNARLNAFNEMVGRDPVEDRNEQLYQSYEIRQMNYYLFSCEYFTAFETTVSNKGVNMIIGSEIDGTLIMNFPALLGNNIHSDGWQEFFIFFNEAREEAGEKEITKEYMTTDNVSFVFEGDDLTDLTLRVLYKTADDTEQQEVPMKLNDIKGCLSERMQVYFSFTNNKDITYGEYAL